MRDLRLANPSQVSFVVMTSTETTGAYTGPERRDIPVRGQRNGLAEWLELHPSTLSRLPVEALSALDLSLEAGREAEEKIARLRRSRRVLEEQVDELRAQALSDALTGASSRRALDVRLHHECTASRRTGNPFAVFLMDADNLKEVNDRYGHAAGDDYLKELTRRLVDNVRGMDMVARLGGDEFVVVCPMTDNAGAADLEARLDPALSADLQVRRGDRVRMSVSLGWIVTDGNHSPHELLAMADAAMYRAKGGRASSRAAEGPAG
jgi:diguanylate cyclase (GGDEF)-like protein